MSYTRASPERTTFWQERLTRGCSSERRLRDEAYLGWFSRWPPWWRRPLLRLRPKTPSRSAGGSRPTEKARTTVQRRSSLLRLPVRLAQVVRVPHPEVVRN